MDDEQDRPVLDGANEATDEARLNGLIEQLRADAAGHDDAHIDRLVRARIADTGLTLSDEEIAHLRDELLGGD